MPQATIQNDKNADNAYTDRSCHQEPALPGKHKIFSTFCAHLAHFELCITQPARFDRILSLIERLIV